MIMNRSIKEIPIQEQTEEIHDLMVKETKGRLKERLQFLYWLKTGKIKTLTAGAKLLGRCRDTVSKWLQVYETEGLAKLLDFQNSPGRPTEISESAIEALSARLSDPRGGFKSYKIARKWLKEEHNCEVSYRVVNYQCHRLRAKHKVPRPYNPNQDPEKIEAFKKTLENC